MPALHPTLVIGRLRRFTPSVWDGVVLLLVIGGLALLALGGRETLQPLEAMRRDPISLDPANLPGYAMRTTLRMFAAMVFSVLFTLVFGVAASRSRKAEMVLVPFVDVMQAVPVLGFLSFTVTFFLGLFPGQVFGAELAAVFAIFTSQAWNMAYSFYESLKTVPRDLRDVSDSVRLGAWRRFWTLEVPYSAPGLIFNAMMSMSGAWFFVVASEAISVGKTVIALPGVGSYVALAIEHHDLRAIGWAVLTMAAVILAYDQLLFRPLVAWSERFRMELTVAEAPPPRSWLLDLLERAELSRRLFRPLRRLLRRIARARIRFPAAPPPVLTRAIESRGADLAWLALIGAAAVAAAVGLTRYLGSELTLKDVAWVAWLATLTLLRVLILTAIASAIWVPIGAWIGLKPKLAEAMQPITQFLAAFPSNLLFPLFVVVIVKYKLNADIWLSPLMILGAQWYVLFNIIGGASTFPNDLREASRSFDVRGWSWWRKVMLPQVFPAYVTGALTASGAAWNAAIVAEVASWGAQRVEAHGLGAYIADASARGDLREVTLGVGIMAVFVVATNQYGFRPAFAYGRRWLGLDEEAL